MIKEEFKCLLTQFKSRRKKTNKNTQATMIGLVPLVCCCMFTVTFIAQ